MTELSRYIALKEYIPLGKPNISQFELKRSESKSDFKALYLLIFLSCALLSKFTLYGIDLQKIFNLKQQNTLK